MAHRHISSYRRHHLGGKFFHRGSKFTQYHTALLWVTSAAVSAHCIPCASNWILRRGWLTYVDHSAASASSDVVFLVPSSSWSNSLRRVSVSWLDYIHPRSRSRQQFVVLFVITHQSCVWWTWRKLEKTITRPLCACCYSFAFSSSGLLFRHVSGSGFPSSLSRSAERRNVFHPATSNFDP